jgi:hypothetical protein
MNSKIEDLFQKFENSRLELFSFLDTFPKEKMNQSISDKKWSVVQVINHLKEAEKGSVLYITKKIERSTKFEKSGFKSTYRYLILRLAFILPIKYKQPPMLDEPTNDMTIDEAKENWSVVRNDMRAILEQMNDEQITSEIFKHPLVGKMNMIQSIKFMQKHFDRHEEQIKNIINQVS